MKVDLSLFSPKSTQRFLVGKGEDRGYCEIHTFYRELQTRTNGAVLSEFPPLCINQQFGGDQHSLFLSKLLNTPVKRDRENAVVVGWRAGVSWPDR